MQIERFLKVGTALPDTTKVGNLFFLIGTPNKLYACFVANAWVEIASSAESGTQVFSETPTGTIDGLNATFTLAHTPVTGTLLLFLQGVLKVSGVDYTLTTNSIVMDPASVPQGADTFLAYYSY
jgi:hypothetical protein